MKTRMNSGIRLLCLALAWSFTGTARAERPSAPIPFSDIGAKATADYRGDALAVTATAEGVRLRCSFQKLEGHATAGGLWLESTEPGGGQLRLLATAVGRERAVDDWAVAKRDDFDLDKPLAPALSPTAQPTAGGESWGEGALARTGTVSVEGNLVQFTRPGLTEEYSVNADGLRQDFVITERHEGAGELSVELVLTGARAEASVYGAKLKLEGSGRELAYSRLRATDATGQELTAHLEVLSADRLAVQVADVNASYPVRIDPTFSDAAWSALGSGMNDRVSGLAVSGTNLYVGGAFTTAGAVPANAIAKWDGSAWSALGLGIGGYNPYVNALAMSGTNLYVGGNFGTAGGVPANYIAKWDGSAWSALDSGMSGPSHSSVIELAVSGTNLYAGGLFYTAGGVSANHIAKWDGSAWSALASGMNNSVHALAVSETNLYAGGTFTTATNAGGVPVTVNRIAKWDGSTWSPLGSGMSDTVYALAVSGTNLYAGGSFFRATNVGGIPVTVRKIAKWNGSAWSALGLGMGGGGTSSSGVYALAVSGSDLYAGGDFITATNAGGVPVTVNRIAKWDGSAWSALGSGMVVTNPFITVPVAALVADGMGHLFAGGGFSIAGTSASPFIAQANLIPARGVILNIGVGGGSVTLDCLGMPSSVYVVQRATDVLFAENLTTRLTTNAPPPDGLFRCTDSNPPNATAFYRLVKQ